MSKDRIVRRSQSVHGKELNRLLFKYVYECNVKSKSQKKNVFEDVNKLWTDYCYKHRKHKVSPPSPDAFKILIRNKDTISMVEKNLGIYKDKSNFITRFIKKLFTK